MSRRFAFLVGVVAALSACDSPAPTGAEPASLEPSFAATTSTINVKVPTTISAFVSCANGGAGEVVTVSGDLHLISHFTVSSSGNVMTKVHNQPQGISGEGLITGNKYQATGVTQRIFHGTGTFTYVNNYRLIGQGQAGDLHVHQNVHVTVNANGDVTASVNNSSIECK